MAKIRERQYRKLMNIRLSVAKNFHVYLVKAQILVIFEYCVAETKLLILHGQKHTPAKVTQAVLININDRRQEGALSFSIIIPVRVPEY